MQTKCPHQLRAVPRIGYYYQDEIPLMRTRLRTVNVILNGESMCIQKFTENLTMKKKETKDGEEGKK